MDIKYKGFKADRIDIKSKGKAKYRFEEESLFAEEYALKIYQKEGFTGVWCEMSLWSEIMTLLFWDIIFVEIQGSIKQFKNGKTFLPHPSDDSFKRVFAQTININGMPSDFFSSEFYKRREDMIENRLKEIRLGEPKEILKRSYNENCNKNARPIENWDLYDLETLTKPFDVINKKAIAKILRRLITNFGQNRKGLPDLFLWKENTGKFVEVKTKHDSLSDHQISWITYLALECKLPVEILMLNCSERKEKNVIEQIEGKPVIIEVSIGKSSSKNWDNAVRLMQRQNNYEEIDGNDFIFKAMFSTSKLEEFYEILDYISHWKNKRILINKQEITTTEIREALWCYRKKIENSKGLDYCRLDENTGIENSWGCKNLYGDYSNNRWDKYGYIDQTTGEWIFDKEALKEDAIHDIERLKLCPFFNIKRILKEIDSIPDKVHPQRDNEWVYVDDGYGMWGYRNGEWINSWGDVNFPGMLRITGIKRLNTYKRIEFGESEGPINYSINITQITDEIADKNKGKNRNINWGCLVIVIIFIVALFILWMVSI